VQTERSKSMNRGDRARSSELFRKLFALSSLLRRLHGPISSVVGRICSVHWEHAHGEPFRHKWLCCLNVGSAHLAKNVRRQRTIAIFSNLAFITYCTIEWLPPVLFLHLVLLPLNRAPQATGDLTQADGPVPAQA